MKKESIPSVLLYCRPLLIVAILFLTFSKYQSKSGLVLILMYTGLVFDILEGILARRFNVSSPKFRLHDTVFDLIFYFSILFYIGATNLTVISSNIDLIIIIVGLESALYSISLIRFRKLPSPHALLSKLWGFYLIVEFTLLIIGVQGSHFRIALFIGVIVHIDRVLIYSMLRIWDHDIPSFFHAYLLRQGKQIKRKPILNG